MPRARRTEPLPPIRARPEPPGRGPHAALSRSQIVEVALTALVLAVDDYTIGYTLRERQAAAQRHAGDGFQDGLDWLLDGFAARHAR